MPRPLRFVPANAIVEVTTRTLQGRLLLRPSPELTDIILGVIGKAQDLYKMSIQLARGWEFRLAARRVERPTREARRERGSVARESVCPSP
jgi:hypothetical protein